LSTERIQHYRDALTKELKPETILSILDDITVDLTKADQAIADDAKTKAENEQLRKTNYALLLKATQSTNTTNDKPPLPDETLEESVRRLIKEGKI
jgi:hypothetical protein